MSEYAGKSRRISERSFRSAESAVLEGYDQYLVIVINMPGTKQARSCGIPAFKVKGNLLSWFRSEAERGFGFALRHPGSPNSVAVRSRIAFSMRSLPRLRGDFCLTRPDLEIVPGGRCAASLMIGGAGASMNSSA